MTYYKFSFVCCGHKNLLGTHKSTFEFTKDKNLTKKGDCIIGLQADFDFSSLHSLCKFKKATLKLECQELSDSVSFIINPYFSSNDEIVIRKSDFISKRTLGILCNKGACDIDRELIEKLKNPKALLNITIIGALK